MRLCRVVLPAILLLSVTGFAQHTRARNKPTARQVVVDVVVTDTTGQPVTGLHEQDFQIFENNKQQQIRSFQAPAPPGKIDIPQTFSLPKNTFTNANSSKPDSISIILMDQLNTTLENQELARQSIIDYVAQKPSGAAFAVFVLRNDDPACVPHSYAQWSFGITHSAITEFDSSCSSRGRLLLVQGVTQDKARLLAALDSKLARPHPTWLRARVQNSSSLGIFSFIGFDPFFKLDSYMDELPEVYDTSLPSLAEMGSYLQSLPGRKSLIWMSDSFDAAPIAQVYAILFPSKFKGWAKTDPFSSVQMVHLTADRLAEARVALYPVDLSGKRQDVQVKRQCPVAYEDVTAALVASQNAAPVRITGESEEWTCNEHFLKLSYVASQSGGRVFHGGTKIQDAMKQAVSDDSNYYALVYSPTKTKFDGKFRRIKVALSRKGYHLAYRRAYYADDPFTLYPPDPNATRDIYTPNRVGPIPWQPVRLAGLNSGQLFDASEPILAELKYGTPESTDVMFAALVDPSGEFEKATTQQMAQLQDNGSFIAERAEKAMANLRNDKQWQRKRTAVVDALPPADAVFLQPYSVDYSLSPWQLTLTTAESGEKVYQLEIAIIAYDALGEMVTNLKQTFQVASGSQVRESQNSDFHFQQRVQIPDRVTLLRLAVRDMSSNRMGSLEIPLWAVSSPYRRKQLQLPTISHDGPRTP